MCDKNCKGKDITEIVDLEMNSVLKFMLQESKKQKKALIATIWLLVICLVGVVLYFNWNFTSFLSQYDYDNSIETTTETNNDAKAFEKNNTINANISDIKVVTNGKK